MFTPFFVIVLTLLAKLVTRVSRFQGLCKANACRKMKNFWSIFDFLYKNSRYLAGINFWGDAKNYIWT